MDGDGAVLWRDASPGTALGIVAGHASSPLGLSSITAAAPGRHRRHEVPTTTYEGNWTFLAVNKLPPNNVLRGGSRQGKRVIYPRFLSSPNPPGLST